MFSLFLIDDQSHFFNSCKVSSARHLESIAQVPCRCREKRNILPIVFNLCKTSRAIAEDAGFKQRLKIFIDYLKSQKQ